MIFESIKKLTNISLLIPVFIFTLDRISKIYVIKLSKNSSDIELFSSKFLNITLIWNEGIKELHLVFFRQFMDIGIIY